MADFRSGGRGGFRGRSGGRSGGFGGNRERRGSFGERRGFDSGRRESSRGLVVMHDATCSKCGKKCQVPFRPTGDKPVLCSDCFRQKNGEGNFGRERESSRGNDSGMSSEQLKNINMKLDKILKVLQDLEIDNDVLEEGDSENDLDEVLDADVEEDSDEDIKE